HWRSPQKRDQHYAVVLDVILSEAAPSAAKSKGPFIGKIVEAKGIPRLAANRLARNDNIHDHTNLLTDTEQFLPWRTHGRRCRAGDPRRRGCLRRHAAAADRVCCGEADSCSQCCGAIREWCYPH